MPDFGGELGKMRTRIGLSQVALATLVSVSEVTIRNWESNISKPKSEHLQRLIEILLQREAFTEGKEQEEAKRFWEEAREGNNRLKAVFDEEWFDKLILNRRRSLTDHQSKQNVGSAHPEIAIEKQIEAINLFQAETLTSKSPKDTTVLYPPPAASGLVGRETEQKWLESRIFEGKIVEISGLGGVGKTTLVADTINRVSSDFRGGIAVILANEMTDPIDIVRQIIEKFVPYQYGLLNRPGIKPGLLYEALKDILAAHRNKDHQVLVVLDNVEPGLIQSEGFKQLCAIFRSLRISTIMTTRPPLSPELVNDSLELKPFTNEAATDLLIRLLEQSLKRFLTDSEKHDAAEICKFIGNHAQAIVWIAGYFQDYEFESLADYLRRLRDRPQIVLDLVDRLRPVETSAGIRVTFASSYSRLPSPTQQLFVALGVLAGRGCTFRAVVALGTVLNQSEDEVRPNLAALRRSKLILETTFDSRGNARINLHPLVQEFARELLKTSSVISEERLHEALADHYIEWIQKTEDELLDADDANIIAALRWANTHSSQEAKTLLANLIYHLRWYWYSRFRFEEAFEWLNIGCKTMEFLDTDFDEMRGELLFAIGIQYQQRGEIEEAESCYRISLHLFEEISQQDGLKVGLGEAQSGLASLLQQKGQSVEAHAYHEKSLATFRKLKDQRGEANALFRLGFLALRTGDTDAAEHYYMDSLNIHLKLADRWGEGIARYSLGDVFQQIGEVDKARSYYEEGLAICRAVHNRRGEGAVLKSLGDLVLQTTGPAEAEGYLAQSLIIFREIFDPQSQGVAMYSMAFLLRQVGKIEEARELYKASLEIRKRVKDERGRGFVLKGLGDLTRRAALHAHDMITAKRQLEEGLAISKSVNDRRNQGVALKAIGDWYWQSGNLSAAHESYEQSLTIRRDFHELRGAAITLKALGDLALREAHFTTGRNRENHLTVGQRNLEESYRIFSKLKDLRGQGVALHSLGILAYIYNDRSNAWESFTKSLELLKLVQDRQSQSTVLFTLALLTEQKNAEEAESRYRESLEIASEVQGVNNIALCREGLGDFLIRRSGGKGKAEGDWLLSETKKLYELLDRHEDVERVEELRMGRNRGYTKERFIHTLIYDLDEGPNGQGFALSNEKRASRSQKV